MKRPHWIVALLLFSLAVASQAFAAQEVGGIAEVVGGVDILKGGKLPAEPAKVGDKIHQGDVIRTKSTGKTQIQFSDESILTIAPDSRVVINEFIYQPETGQRQASIKIFYGLMHTLVTKIFKKEKPDFIVETQTAVIGVRGTDYFTLAAPVTSDIYNNSGATEVNNIFPEIPGKVSLKGKEYTQVGLNRPPTLPLPLTQDDINWIKGQMTPKMLAKPSGAVSNQEQLLSKVAESSLETQKAGNGMVRPVEQNIIQNLQSAVFVPPQPVPQPGPAPLPTPYNIYIFWGSGAQDLDLYLTGPLGPNGAPPPASGNSTFQVYYGNSGSLTSQPFAYYHYDSMVPNGGEVITIGKWNQGDNYVVSVNDWTNRNNPQSTVLSNSSGVQMRLIQGGTVSIVPVNGAGSAARVEGGTVLHAVSPPGGKEGNTWTAVSINPSTGVVTPINRINGGANNTGNNGS